MKTAYLSLGANLGDRETALCRALELLAGPDLRVVRVSSLYETEPVDRVNQPWFLNLAAEVETDLFPMQLLARAQKVERELGRRRLIPKGPRTIDIDILLYGDSIVDTATLTVPHPRMHERRFVLEPLAEIAPQLRDPVTKRTVAEMLGELAGQKVKRYK